MSYGFSARDLSRRALGLLAAALASGCSEATAAVVIDGERFVHTDELGSTTGRIFVPAHGGPHAALVLAHGQGGSPAAFPNWSSFASWDLVLIAPELTHVAGGETAPATTGHAPENLRRIEASLRALAELGGVDPSRIAVFGHSKGAYAAVGAVAALGTQVRVAAITAGGVVPDSFGVAQAAPTYTESAGVTAPFLLLHGSVDDAVPPERSADFASRLAAAEVRHERFVYDVAALPPSTQHNLHQDPEINADLLARLVAWFALHGLFAAPESPLFAHGFETD